MTACQDVSEALEGMRGAFRANGCDIVVDGVDGDVARLRLVFAQDACHDCVIEGDLLTSILLTEVTKHVRYIGAIEVDDPRASPAPEGRR